MYHRKVSNRNVGNNPVARAVAKQALAKALRDQKIRLYLMDEGEACAEMCEGVGMTLAVVGYASELAGLGETPQNKVLRGGLSACQQMLHSGKWVKLNTVAVVNALDAAEALNHQIKADYINKAWHALAV
jgi:hypothetical protein